MWTHILINLSKSTRNKSFRIINLERGWNIAFSCTDYAIKGFVMQKKTSGWCNNICWARIIGGCFVIPFFIFPRKNQISQLMKNISGWVQIDIPTPCQTEWNFNNFSSTTFQSLVKTVREPLKSSFRETNNSFNIFIY